MANPEGSPVSASLADGPAVQEVNPVKFKSRQRSPSQPLAEFVVKKSRGDKTAVELFIGGIRGWEGDLRRRISDDKSYANKVL